MSALLYPRLALLLIVLAPKTMAQDGRSELGRAYAEKNCATCHSLGPTGASRLPAAPPFRILHQRYPVGHLAEALAEGIATGHDAMPEFRLNPAQIEDFLAYLKTLER